MDDRLACLQNLNQLPAPVQSQSLQNNPFPDAFSSPLIDAAMYLISCPQGHSFSVSTSAAGSEVACPTCGAATVVPKLGQLRQLPRAEQTTKPAPTRQTGFAARIAFAILMFVAIGALVSAAFGYARWYSLPVPITTEYHIERDREQIEALNPVQLLSVWEEYENTDFSMQTPYPYQRMQGLRDEWMSVATTSASVGFICTVLAIFFLVFGRTTSSPLDT